MGSSRSSVNRLKFAFDTPLERRKSSLFLRRSARDLSSSLFLCSSFLIIFVRCLWRRQPGCVFSRRSRKYATRSACEDEDEPQSLSLSSSGLSSSDMSTAGISLAKSTSSDIDRISVSVISHHHLRLISYLFMCISPSSHLCSHYFFLA